MPLTRLSSKKDYIRVMFYWKTQAILVYLLIVASIMLFAYTYTPVYESTARILVLPRTSEGIVISSGTDEKKLTPVAIEDINTEIELLSSNAVLEKALRHFSGAGLGLKAEKTSWHARLKQSIKNGISKILLLLQLKEPLSPFESNMALLRNSLTVEPVARSNVIVVKLQAERPRMAAKVLNTILQVYIRHHNEVFSKQEGAELFSSQADDYRRRLLASEKMLNEFQRKYNIVDIEKQNAANIKFITDLKEQLKEIQIAHDEAKSRIAIIQNQIENNPKDVLITREMRTIPAIVELERGIVPLLIKRSELLKGYTSSSREVQNIETQILLLREHMKKEIVNALRTDELELESMKTKERSLRRRIKELEDNVAFLNKQNETVKDLEREVLLYDNNYSLYASKTEDARIQGERVKRNLANISIADHASLPSRPVFPNKLLLLVVSLTVGFFAASGTPFLLEFLDHRLKIAYDVEEFLSLPVVCTLPEKTRPSLTQNTERREDG